MDTIKLLSKYILVLFLFVRCGDVSEDKIKTPLFFISWSDSVVDSWNYTISTDRKSIKVKLPIFEIDGKQTPAILTKLEKIREQQLVRNEVMEYLYEGPFQKDTSIHLQLKLRVANDNPVVRFTYELKTSGQQKLTKKSDTDDLTYLSYSMKDWPKAKEIRLSVFNELIHSCNLTETEIYESDFSGSPSLVGPIIIGTNGEHSFLVSYEHDSMYPNNFLRFKLAPNKNIALEAVKGNYCSGQPVDGYSTVWFEVAGIKGDEDLLADQFRTFILKHQSEHIESRKPYIFYNTWGRQERIKWAGGQYLTTMTLEYTLREIDKAHEMGLEYYVLDAGWSDRSGDWCVNLKLFPDGFRKIRDKLNGYGMKLGVWMDPSKAAITSNAFIKNKGCLKSWNGKIRKPSMVWETELSNDMCLVSPYWEYYADLLITLYKDLDIRCFYFDGVGQKGCNDPGHFHGTSTNSSEERNQNYAFLLPVYLGKIMEKVGSSCPDVIFEFDVTEPGRIGVGLQFLANGRYFILNNGPYYHNFDLVPRGKTLLTNGCKNIFIQPGPARSWIIRSVLDYDKWIPSNLFSAKYQADDPENSQLINLGSMLLGHFSIWGEIIKTSQQGVKLFHDVLEKYKPISLDVIASGSLHFGNSGDSPEVFEKVNPETGKGIVVVFSNTSGKFSYVTKQKVSDVFWHNQGVDLKIDTNHHASIDAEFKEASAAIILFGVK